MLQILALGFGDWQRNRESKKPLETSGTYLLVVTLYSNALNRIANSFSPIESKPPNATTA